MTNVEPYVHAAPSDRKENNVDGHREKIELSTEDAVGQYSRQCLEIVAASAPWRLTMEL